MWKPIQSQLLQRTVQCIIQWIFHQTRPRDRLYKTPRTIRYRCIAGLKFEVTGKSKLISASATLQSSELAFLIMNQVAEQLDIFPRENLFFRKTSPNNSKQEILGRWCLIISEYKNRILVVLWSLELPKRFRAFCGSGYQSPILELSGYSLPNPSWRSIFIYHP